MSNTCYIKRYYKLYYLYYYTALNICNLIRKKKFFFKNIFY